MAILLIASVSFSIIIFRQYINIKSELIQESLNCKSLIKELGKVKERPKSVELKEFLGDLMRGDALISVHRIDGADMFSFSPKDKGML